MDRRKWDPFGYDSLWRNGGIFIFIAAMLGFPVDGSIIGSMGSKKNSLVMHGMDLGK